MEIFKKTTTFKLTAEEASQLRDVTTLFSKVYDEMNENETLFGLDMDDVYWLVKCMSAAANTGEFSFE